MFSKFPLLMPMNISKNPIGFEGFIELERDEYIKILCPKYPTTENMEISGSVRLNLYLQKYSFETTECQTLENFLVKLQSFCISESAEKCNQKKSDEFALYSNVVCHLEKLGWSKVAEVSENFSLITLQLVDKKKRKSYLKIELLSGYPIQSPIFEADLPYIIHLKWNPTTHLSGIYKQWENEILKLQYFWDVLDSIDETAHVIDPEMPTRKHKYRRILLENLVSVQLTFSISHPCSLPQWQFFGPVSKVEPLNAKMVENFNIWNDIDSPIKNIENMLGLNVVEKLNQKEQFQDWDMECAVCYCLYLDDQLPDVHGDCCQKKFHVFCLFEWLRSISTSRQSIQTITGECPHCSKVVHSTVNSEVLVDTVLELLWTLVHISCKDLAIVEMFIKNYECQERSLKFTPGVEKLCSYFSYLIFSYDQWRIVSIILERLL